MIAGIDFTLKVDYGFPQSRVAGSYIRAGVKQGLTWGSVILRGAAKNLSFKKKGTRGTINKLKGRYSLRYITGDLRDSIETHTTAREIILSAGNAAVPYAKLHEYGGTSENFNKRVPARPFLTPVVLDSGSIIENMILGNILRRFGDPWV